MDYRHTEDFARRVEAAELRAQMLRDQALDGFFAAVGRVVRQALRRVVHPRRCANHLQDA